MPRRTYAPDSFDDLTDTVRVGAHRAENPGMHGGIVFVWALAATAVLTVGGIAGALLVLS